MKFIFSTIGTTGDINPFIETAKCLQQSGHTVTFLCAESMLVPLKQLSIPAIAVISEEQFEAWANLPLSEDSTVNDYRVVVHLTLQSIDAVISAVESEIEPGNTLLIGTVTAAGLKLASEKLNLPYVSVALSPWNEAAIEKYNDFFGGVINRFRRHNGLPIVNGNIYGYLESIGERIALYPSWFTSLNNISSIKNNRYFGFMYNLAEDSKKLEPEIVSFLEKANDDPILFTFGTHTRNKKNYFDICYSVVCRLGKRAIFLSKDEKAIPADTTESCLCVSYASLKNLLPKVKAVVYHGGIGTCAQVLRAGVPQLVCPGGYDQFENASTIRDLKLGRVLNIANFSEETLYDELSSLVGDDEISKNVIDVSIKHIESDNNANAFARYLESIPMRVTLLNHA